MSFPIEEVSRYPLPGMAVPADLKFSPDDNSISYLLSPDRTLVNELCAFLPVPGKSITLVSAGESGDTEENITLEEALRRERIRSLILGITQYDWVDNHHVLIPIQGDLYVKDIRSGPLRKVFDSHGHSALSPTCSPDGEWIAFVQEAELFITPVGGGEPRQLTWGARESGKTHGLAEFIAQEEMGREQGYWWSPDSQCIAFAEVDETHIPIYRILHQGQPIFDETAQEDHRYPFAGNSNARVRLGVVCIQGIHEPVWMDITSALPDPTDYYLARVNWFPDGNLLVQVENRLQNELYLLDIDPKTGQSRLIHKEVNPVWINLHDIFTPLKKAKNAKPDVFIWASEKSGFRHLVLVDRSDGSVRPLTSGEWVVDALLGVDEEGGLVYFSGTLDGPTECRLYCVPLDGGKPRCLTPQPGMHKATLDHVCRRFVDVHHSLSQPPTVSLRSLEDGSLLADIYSQADPRLAQLNLKPPELVSLQNRHGDLLYGAIFYPSQASQSKKPYPLIVSVYGGPQFQMVTNGWNVTVSMRAQYLSSLGFIVFMLDNRGSSRRGLGFESVIKNNLGRLEVEDQVDGVRWMIEQKLADPAHVGIYGWSYGGYLSAMCLGQAPEVFRAAVVGAPVTNYDGYDTHYTERYMGKPQDDPKRYAASSVMRYVENMTGSLMLVHGLIDENVHFRHTARLINALIQARKRYDLLLFPDERHMPRRLSDRVFMEENIRDFFMRELS
jgi:dipeptidyl-peptidase 4